MKTHADLRGFALEHLYFNSIWRNLGQIRRPNIALWKCQQKIFHFLWIFWVCCQSRLLRTWHVHETFLCCGNCIFSWQLHSAVILSGACCGHLASYSSSCIMTYWCFEEYVDSGEETGNQGWIIVNFSCRGILQCSPHLRTANALIT